MKKILLSLSLLVLTSLKLSAAPAEAGPRGGRLLEKTPLAVEFWVSPDRVAEIGLTDSRGQPVAPTEQTVVIIAEPKSGRVTLATESTPQGFRTVNPLPAGEPYRVVVQYREQATARPKNYRIDLNLSLCGGCQLGEYACICEGH